MECFCCKRGVPLARKVKARQLVDFDPASHGPGSAAHQSYVEEMTYRWAVVCQACYLALDNGRGMAELSGRMFNLAGSSRGDRARTMNEAQYREWQWWEAERLGLGLGGAD